MLVDDHGVFRQGVGLILKERAGIESIQARSLAEARRVLADVDGRVDLAVIDLDLPDGDGIALIKTLRKTSPGARVLALTSTKEMERRGRALQEGANEVHFTASSGEGFISAAERLLGA